MEENDESGVDVDVYTVMANRAVERIGKAYYLNLRLGNKSVGSKFLLMGEMSDDITIGIDCLRMLNFELIDIDNDPRIQQMATIRYVG